MKRLVLEAKTEAVEVRIESDEGKWGWVVISRRVWSPATFDDWWEWMSNPIQIQEVIRDLVES